MRLWSLHPAYLDTRGLAACWREGLLARKVLRGETKGYRSHPQLERFKAQPDPLGAIDAYLLGVYAEAARRGFAFERGKIGPVFAEQKIPVTEGQLAYELEHLREKLRLRDPERYGSLAGVKEPLVHPAFRVVPGGVESWERVRG